MSKKGEKKKVRPAQEQKKQPGLENKMMPKPVVEDSRYVGSNKLKNKIAVITGGDSGIGSAVAIAFAKEGADVAIIYLEEHDDARQTQLRVEQVNRKCFLIPGNIEDEDFCKNAIKKIIHNFEKIDVLVNNAAVQFPQDDFLNITAKQIEQTFRTNIFSFFYLTQAALPFMGNGTAIINTTSVTAYRGSKHLIDYASTKGAIVSFTRSLAQNLAEKGIRVNGVAPGPVWTPLIPSSFDKKQVAQFGSDVPLKRAAQPFEIAPSFVFLASDDSSYYTGQILHPNGGEIING
ncbi:MAG: SDR family oxidoreductase [Bacteroidetes bacterium]|nr:SDR family oxidoreductase [Bacteroidota bacterium]HET6243409.1 SDR family oxidoreductase [Bacteroidia bacterium]